MTRLIEQLKEGGTNPDLYIEGILMTMYDMRTNLSQQVVQEVIQHYGDKVYETLIPRNIRLGEAPSFGKPIITYNSYSTGAAAYRQFAKEFIERHKHIKDVLNAPAIDEESDIVPTISSEFPPEQPAEEHVHPQTEPAPHADNPESVQHGS